MLERGLIEVRRGKGTFVTQPKITQELTELTGFVEGMQALGRTPTARLLDSASWLVGAHEDNLVNGVTSLQQCGNKDAGYDPLQNGIAPSRPRAT